MIGSLFGTNFATSYLHCFVGSLGFQTFRKNKGYVLVTGELFRLLLQFFKEMQSSDENISSLSRVSGLKMDRATVIMINLNFVDIFVF